METVTTPGVYVREVSQGPRPITSVGMSTPAFLGITRSCPEGKASQPVGVSSWTDFLKKFGTPHPNDKTSFEVFAKEAYLPDAIYGYFNNGGGYCYVVSLYQLDKQEEKPSDGVVEADESNAQTKSPKSPSSKPSAKSPQSKLTKDAFIGERAKRTGLEGLRAFEDVRLISCPDLMYLFDSEKDRESIQKAMLDQCDNLRDRFAILDTPQGLDDEQVLAWREKLGDSSYGALYYPWIEVANFTDEDKKREERTPTRLIPPSGYVVGVYNRTDSERGVHKAPANEIMRGVLGLERELNKEENGKLNEKGVNCIRAFTGRGIRVWGARTLSSDTQWRYINVRRLFIMVANSLQEGLHWVTFEPNNHELWAKVRRDITFFLDLVWRSGALFGQTADEAFYVKCDAELNDLAVRDQGQLIIEVGLCPTKPAEFVIIRLSQWAGHNAESG